METKFKLKKGIVLRQHGKVYKLTHLNLTDELAIKHLKANPGDMKYFDYIPPEALNVIKGEAPKPIEKKETKKPRKRKK